MQEEYKIRNESGVGLGASERKRRRASVERSDFWPRPAEIGKVK